MHVFVMAAIAGITFGWPLSSPSADDVATDRPAAKSIDDLFVNGPPDGSLEQATLRRLDAWLPDTIRNDSVTYRQDRQKSEDVIALAKAMGYGGRQVWERDGRDSEKRVIRFSASGAANFLKDVAERDAVLKTAARLPSMLDIYHVTRTEQNRKRLSRFDNQDRREAALQDPGGGANRQQRAAEFERYGFQELDSWLPNALAGQGDMPDDAASQALVVTFAERLGWSDQPKKPGNANRRSVQRALFERARQEARNRPIADKAREALIFLKQRQFLQKSLIAEGERPSAIIEGGPAGVVVQLAATSP